MTMRQIRAKITDWDVSHKSVYVMVSNNNVRRVTLIGRKWVRVLSNAGQFEFIAPAEVVEIMM